MAKNFVCDGKVITYTNATGADIKSGAVVVIGDTIGVALVDINDDLSGAAAIEGVFEVRKAAIEIDQGKKVYFDADGNPVGAVSGNGLSGTGSMTIVTSGNVYAGRAVAHAANSAEFVQIKLNA